MKKLVSFLLASVIASSSTVALADNNESARKWRIPVGVYSGLSGFGVKAGFEWRWIGIYGTAASTFNLSAKLNKNINEDGIALDNLKLGISLQDYGIDLRARPFQGAFHIDVGYHYLNFQATANANVTVDLKQFANDANVEDLALVSGPIGMKLSVFKGWKPYFGLGWDWNLVAQLHLSLDLGVMYVGNYNLSAKLGLNRLYDGVKKNIDVIIDKARSEASRYNDGNVTGADITDILGDVVGVRKLNEWKKENNINNNTKLSDEQIASVSAFTANALLDEAENEANDNFEKSISSIDRLLDRVKVYPMIKIGLTYKF